MKKSLPNEEKMNVMILNKNKEIDVFSLLPNVCISEICNYLNKETIQSFKSTSRNIGIVCFEQMQKISIGTLHILNLNHIQSNLIYHNPLNEFIKWERYPAHKKYTSLSAEWEIKYAIPQEYQLIFKYQEKNYKKSYEIMNINDEYMNTHRLKKNIFLIMDKRKMVIFDGNNGNERRFDLKSDSFDNLKNYKLTIFEYLDIINNTSHIAAFILYNNDEIKSKVSFYRKVFDYVEHRFKMIDTMDNSWYYGLKSNLNKMSYRRGVEKLCTLTINGNLCKLKLNKEHKGHIVKIRCKNSSEEKKSLIQRYYFAKDLITKTHIVLVSQFDFVSHLRNAIMNGLNEWSIRPENIQLFHKNSMQKLKEDASIIELTKVDYKIVVE